MLEIQVHLERHIGGKHDITGRTRNRFFQDFFLSDISDLLHVGNIPQVNKVNLLLFPTLRLWPLLLLLGALSRRWRLG